MTNPNDLYITYSGFANNDQIIDSYELIHSLITEFGGQASFRFLVDPTLPMIKGDRDFIIGVFKDFILKTISEFKQHLGIVNVVHIKDPKSWIFAFSIDQKSSANEKPSAPEIIDPIQEFNLAISKKALQNLSEVPSVIAYL
ncbi:hypothetical protein V8V91_04380 [Algoriphagus halophilus]|uniref:hypothetical protein n=1 Tax=Algoriphagus halophilus TaxID=226505 RepID=UPI00359013BD